MNNVPGNASQNANAGNKDYLDKGLEAAEKKFGGSWGQDTEKNRNVNEKIVWLPPSELRYIWTKANPLW